ncbi:MAG: hypothetical protein IJZ86_09600 [Bacteroides sp.]|nr:hypothetical protein [Bacteroides sp.]
MKIFYLTLIVSIALMVGGFLVPPPGVIDGSVLTAVGELLMFAALSQLPEVLKAVRDGKRITISKGDFKVGVESGEMDN